MATRRSSEREPAGSLGNKSNIIGGWLPPTEVVVRAAFALTTKKTSR